MSIITRIKSGVADFINGVRVLLRGTRGMNTKGDKKLAYMSRIVLGQIDVYGTRAVRTQVIKSIESDFRKIAEKGDEVEKMIQDALATPDYMKLLRKLGLREPHIRVMAMHALKEADQKRRSK